MKQHTEPQNERSLDTLLMRRANPPETDDLALRIIASARNVPQQQPRSLSHWLGRRLAGFREDLIELALPRPAYAYALASLILGLALGVSGAITPTSEAEDMLSLQAFLSPDIDEEAFL